MRGSWTRRSGSAGGCTSTRRQGSVTSSVTCRSGHGCWRRTRADDEHDRYITLLRNALDDDELLAFVCHTFNLTREQIVEILEKGSSE